MNDQQIPPMPTGSQPTAQEVLDTRFPKRTCTLNTSEGKSIAQTARIFEAVPDNVGAFSVTWYDLVLGVQPGTLDRILLGGTCGVVDFHIEAIPS